MKAGLLALGFAFLIVIACKDQESNKEVAQDQTPVAPTEPSANQIPVAKSPTTTKYKSYPEVLRTLFSEYSYMNEVRDILGKSEYIQQVDDNTQIWFYGKGEIIFKGRFAVEVRNGDVLKGYRTIHQLFDGDDYNEFRLGRELLDRAGQISTQIETH